MSYNTKVHVEQGGSVLNIEDDGTLEIGTGSGGTGDVQIKHDGTNLILAALADDHLIEIGDSATTQLSFDLKWYGNAGSGADYLYYDASANLVYTIGIDVQFKDNDYLVFGTGAGATGDVNIRWDTANLIIAAVGDDTLIEFGDSAATQLSFDLKVYGEAANGADYLHWDASVSEFKTVGSAKVNLRSRFELFDDFLQQTLAETDTPWILNSGNDAEAIDPAINAQECGVVRVTTGDADGTTANDGSQLICHIPVQGDSGGLVFEARLHINTAVTDISVCVGLTDVTGLEEPFTIAGGSITSTATDAVCFVYDTAATTDEWFACAVDGDTDDTGNVTTTVAPTADTYQVFRIEVSADGATIAFYIDGTLRITLSGAAGVSPDVNLYATVIACATTTTSKTVDVDYIYVGHDR